MASVLVFNIMPQTETVYAIYSEFLVPTLMPGKRIVRPFRRDTWGLGSETGRPAPVSMSVTAWSLWNC